MDLIATHVNADFDALGSLVAAKKLYPHSRLLLPGSQEQSVRQFLALAKELVVFESERECRLYDVSRLVLVDTRQKSRIGIASELVDKGVEVHVYDHHPRMKDDVVADKDVYENVGATVTILADIIKRNGHKITPLEATIMLLGIYEETGSLTYRTTTKLDVDIVSFLLSKGANLSIVSGYINRELTEGELAMLTKLITVTKKTSVKGVSVSIAEIGSDSYSGELGLIVHKLMEIENIPVLFVIVDNPGKKRVDIIGRSSIAFVDVNRILSHFGGGGHPGAASAKIRGKDLDEVKNKLMKILARSVKYKVRAKDIMSRNAKTLNVNTKVSEAKKILLKEGSSGMPVLQKGAVTGVITLEGLNKAINRGFGHSKVKGYMSRNIITLEPKTPLYAIHKAVVDEKAGILPVIEKKKLVGVISRTDVLKNIHSGLFRKPDEINKKITMNLYHKMSNILPAEIMSLLRRIGRLGNAQGHRVFIIGGLVRDVLLGKKNLDLDIVVEGDAEKLGRLIAAKMNASLVVHKKFGTCTVVAEKGLKIDLATARKEVYEKPAALPTVEFSSLKDDLMRRDFTINAMAVSLNRASFGQLIDFFGGESDLRRGRIRVLHDGSFIDDPTRIFRAVRFEQRFAFSIDPHTEELIKKAIKIEMFERVEPQRIRDEIISILKEEDPLKAIKRMAELDELRFLHPRIKLDADMVSLFDKINRICAMYEKAGFKKRSIDTWLVYFMALLRDLDYSDAVSICDRFVFRKGERIRILSSKKEARPAMKALESRLGLSPSRIYGLLEPLSFEVILLLWASSRSKSSWSRINDFFRKYNGVKIKIKGNDLKILGLKPCPDYRKILDKVLFAKIDGKLRTKRDEIEFAGRMVKKISAQTGR